jgi:hypothetical protein
MQTSFTEARGVLGLGPKLELQNSSRSTFAAHGTTLCDRFEKLENTRISSRRRMPLSAQVSAGSGVFLTKDHGQRTMVGAVPVRVAALQQP